MGKTWKKWTDDQVQILREKYGRTPTEQLGEELGRSRGALVLKALHEGLTTKPSFTETPIDRCSEVDLAWLAAIIEGEGSLYVRMYKDGYYNTWVEIANTEIEILQSCGDLMGGTLRMSQHGSLTKKPQYKLQLTGFVNVRHALELLRPFMRGSKRKRKIAKLMMEFCELSEAHFWKRKTYPPEVKARKLELYQQIKALNKKGPQP